MNVFIFAGQSNMQGADSVVAETGVFDMAAAGLQQAADRATLFTYAQVSDWDRSSPNNYTSVYPDGEAFGDIRGHMGPSMGIDGFHVHGPEVGFARTMAMSGMTSSAVIKFAGNYRSLENGRSAWCKDHSRYTDLAEFVKARLVHLTAAGHDPIVRGFVWHQGIDDALLGRSQSAYMNDLSQVICSLREDFEARDAPFVVARSFSSPMAGRGKMEPIRDGQVATAESLPAAAWVDVDDLPAINIHHFSSASQLIIGERFGKAMLELMRKVEPGSRFAVLSERARWRTRAIG